MNRKTIIFVGAVALTVLAVAGWLERRSRFPIPDSHSVSSSASSGGSVVSSASGPASDGGSVESGGPVGTSGDKAWRGSLSGGVTGPVSVRGARAWVGEGRGARELSLNQLGEYERVYVAARQQVAVAVGFPDGDAGEAVGVSVMDGGRVVEVDAVAGVRVLDKDRVARFTYEASGDEGTHRVLVRRGGERRVLDFWVGTEPALAQR